MEYAVSLCQGQWGGTGPEPCLYRGLYSGQKEFTWV
jgi:hypothetical protein